MIACPNCHHNEIEGALFCSECGSMLGGMPGLATQSIGRNPSSQLADLPKAEMGLPSIEINQAAVSVCVVDSGQVLPLEDRDEFTLGRSAEGQPILPDVDLA